LLNIATKKKNKFLELFKRIYEEMKKFSDFKIFETTYISNINIKLNKIRCFNFQNDVYLNTK